jgi:hypoxanthine phosphoribosyltransferase
MVVYPVKRVSWDEVVDWCYRLGDRVRESGFRHDVIVAVGRGGYTVARILSDYLGVAKVIGLPIRWVKQGGGDYLEDLILCFYRFKEADVGQCISDVVKQLRLEVAVDVKADLSGLKALAVEEISATGVQLAKARDIIAGWGAEEVKTAALVWKKSTSTLKPDYTFIETPSFVWFQFPWSRLSDYKSFTLVIIKEVLAKRGKPFSISDVEKLFMEWYGFKPERLYLVKALEKLATDGIVKSVDRDTYVIASHSL